jgi:hypothetical protein
MLRRLAAAIFAWLACVYAAGALAVTPAAVASPANGSTLTGATQTFQWNAASGATLYQLWVGTTPGTYDIGYFPAEGVTTTSWTVTVLPTDGRTLYVTLWSNIGGTYYSSASTYMAASHPSGGAVITNPPNGSAIGATQTFQWNAAPGATLYQLWFGTTPGAFDIGYFPAGGLTTTSWTVSGLPTDGRTLYVTLWSMVGGVYQSTASTYVASGGAPPEVAASITNPTNGSLLPGSSATFQWNAATGAQLYQVWLGNSAGAYDIGYSDGTMNTSTMLSSLPTDGRTLYVRLWTGFASGYKFNDYTYVAATVAPDAPAQLDWPAAGASLAGATDTFRWNAAPDAYGYQLWVGTTPGGFDVGFYPEGLASDTTVDATGLPTDGRQLYVRLWTASMDGYTFSDSTYYANGPHDIGLRMPTLGWTLSGPAQAFDWQSLFHKSLTIGNSVGSAEFGNGSAGGLDITFSNLPIDGRTLYARSTWWTDSPGSGPTRFRDYQLTAAPSGPAAVMLLPFSDQQLFGVGATRSFTFSDVGASAYKIWAGSTVGGQEYGEFPSASGTTSTTIAITNPPGGIVPTHIRLWSQVGGVWYYRDYAYRQTAG